MLDLIFTGTLCVSIFIVVLLIYIAAKSLRNSSDDDDHNQQLEQRSSRQSTSSSLPSSLRHRGRQTQNTTNQHSGDENESDENDGGFDFDDSALKGKIGVKKQRKLEMKAEKKQARENELQEREERKKRMEELDKQRKLEDEKLAAEEKAKAEAERLEKERKEKEEYEEYLKLKQCFEVEEEGYDGDVNEEDSQNKLQTFIDYIKDHKVVHMDELAGNFNLKTQDVIQRLQELLEQELLLGVIDDRGKFIYITNEELQEVAKFIRQRGRVSISELAENSNTFINLVPVEANN